MRRLVLGSLGFLFVAYFAAAAFSWEGGLANYVQPISVVKDKAESGDLVVVEGTVAEVRSGDGGMTIVIFRDSSGTVPTRVPNSLLRKLAGTTPQGGSGPGEFTPTVGKKARVGGKWDHKNMDDETWGIHVQRIEPFGP